MSSFISSCSDAIQEWLHSLPRTSKAGDHTHKSSLFSIPPGLLCHGPEKYPDSNGCSTANSVNPIAVSPSTSEWKCRLCSANFMSHREQQLHFKSDSHVANIRRYVLGLESQGDDVECEQESDDENSSSDDNDLETTRVASIDAFASETLPQWSEGAVRKKVTKYSGVQVMFEKCDSLWTFGISVAVLGVGSSESKDNSSNNSIDNPWALLSRTLSAVHTTTYSCVLLLRSGRFAAGVFCGSTPVVHKTFRRYTVRAKAGGGQSSFDSGGRKAKSVGAMLRRYGEQALQEDIHTLLMEWRSLLDSCLVILMAVPRTMNSYVYCDEIKEFPLKRSDARVRSIPFMVGKPTFEEVCIVHKKCFTVTFESVDSVKDEAQETGVQIVHNQSTCIPEICAKAEVNDSTNLDAHRSSPPPLLSTAQQNLVDSVCAGDICGVSSALETLRIDEDFQLSFPSDLSTLMTPLHLAAERSQPRMVTALLKEGASPCTKDVRGRYPYFLAKNKDTRDAFRRYRAFAEEKWDWDQCGVPGALTDEKLRHQREKEKEKKKRAKKKKKDEQIALAEAELKAERELEAKLKNDKESAGVCAYCEKSLYKIEALNVFDRLCCSSACVNLLRRKLAADAAERRFQNK